MAESKPAFILKLLCQPGRCSGSLPCLNAETARFLGSTPTADTFFSLKTGILTMSEDRLFDRM